MPKKATKKAVKTTPAEPAEQKPALPVLGDPLPAAIFPDPATFGPPKAATAPARPVRPFGPVPAHAAASVSLPARVISPTFGAVPQSVTEARRLAKETRDILGELLRRLDATDRQAAKVEDWMEHTPDAENLLTTELIDVTTLREAASMARHMLNTLAPPL
jgi:hypothetical protein